MDNTGPGHVDHSALSFALSEMQKISDNVQEARKRSENMQKVLEIKNSLSGAEVIIMTNIFVRKGINIFL